MDASSAVLINAMALKDMISALKQTFTQWTQNEATALAVVDSLAMRHGDGRSTLPSTQERLGAWAKDTLTNYRGEGRPPFDLVGLLRVLTHDRFPAPTGAMASSGSMDRGSPLLWPMTREFQAWRSPQALSNSWPSRQRSEARHPCR